MSGNAGGIAVRGRTVAVVNFGSGSVSIFNRRGDDFELTRVLAAVSPPVSVAFRRNHLYVLGTTTVESHRIDRQDVDPTPDGVRTLLRTDGSAAQVGVSGDQLVIAEKSNAVEVALLSVSAHLKPRKFRRSSSYVFLLSSLLNEKRMAVGAVGISRSVRDFQGAVGAFCASTAPAASTASSD